MKWLLRVVLLLAFIAGTSNANEYVWREGEDATGTNFNHHGWYQNDASVDKTLMSPGTPGGTAGDWAADYQTGTNNPRYIEWDDIDVTEGGTYTWWARIAPVNTSYSYQVDGGAAVNVDMSQQHEVLDIIRPGINDVHYLGWVELGTINLTPGTHTLRINDVYNAAHNSTIGGVDCICLVNFQWTPTGALQPPGSSTNPDPTPGPGVWFPLHVGKDAFSADSITDMHDVVAATTGMPAGSMGHVMRVEDHFELSGNPGVPVKFWGITATHPSSSSVFDQQARLYVKYGVNLVRRHPMISEVGESMSAAAMDTYDRWFKALKDNGIYTQWSVFYPDNVGLSRSTLPASPSASFQTVMNGAGVTADQLWNELPAGSGATKKVGGFDNFVEWYQEGEWDWESSLLQHVNPYTGMAYKDDPALAIVEVQNEDSVFWHSPLSDGFCNGSDYPNHHKLLVYMWYLWLQNKYGSDANLQAAWGSGLRSGDSVVTFNPNMKIYAAWEMAADGPFFNKSTEKARMGDWIRFLAETQRAHYEARFAHLRGIGYQGVQLSTAWKAGGPAASAANLWTDDAGDAIDRHAYTGGGAGGHYVATGSVDNMTHLSQPGHGILGGESIDAGGSPVSVFQVEDKPALMSEWNQNPPNQWRAEAAPLYAIYGMGLQGWDASLHFAGSYPWMETGWPGQGRGPTSYVDETPLYMGQYPALARLIYGGYIQQGAAAAARRVSVDDVFRGIDCLSQALPNGGYPGQDNIYTPPEVTAIGRLSFKADDSLTSSDSARVDWSTYWDQTNKIITSTTGQLVWNYNDRVVQVKAAKEQGLIGWAGGKGTYDLGDVQINVNSATPFCSLLVTPLDGENLSTSSHILVTAVAQDTEQGAAYGSGGTTLTALGGPPLLLQPVQATITLGGDAIESVKSVDIYGVPTSTELSVSGNQFTINGNYTTIYYEINRAQTPRPTIALSTTALNPSCVVGGNPSDNTFQVWNTGTVALNYTVSDDAAWLSVDPASGSSADAGDKQTETVTYDASGLSAGTYTATITVSDGTASNDPQTIAVTLKVQTPPGIALSKASLSPTVTVGSNAVSDSFQVWDSGDVALSYTVTDDVAWLNVTPGTGSSGGVDDKQTHTVVYSTDTLPVGTYDGTITVSSAGATNSPQTIAVHLTVQQAPPAISRDPATLTPTCVRGFDAPDGSFQVWNGGGDTLGYTISDNASWLSVSAASGSSTGASDKQTHTVSYTTSGLGQGVYNAVITITAAGAPNSPQTIAVQLTVQPAPPSIELSTTALSPFCAQTQDALDGSFQVWNTGDGTLSYTVSDNVPWLSVLPTGGTSTGTGQKVQHTVSYTTSGLAQGDYDAVITVSAAGADNSPRTIDVHLSVLSAPPAISFSPMSLSPTCLSGTEATSGSIEIWNSGEGTLNYTVYTSVPGGASWLSVSPGTGSSTDSAHKGMHAVQYSTAGLSAGVYHASIVITSPGAQTEMETVPVTLTVTATNSIGADKASFSPSCMVGGNPAADQLQVWNAVSGTMDYTISDDAAWLSVSPAGGTSTGPADVHAHDVTYTASGLSPGVYDATITIVGVGADNTPLEVPVELTVLDSSGPGIHITWPTAADSPLNASMITVTGTASDPTGVAGIWVNGVQAVNTGTGFSTWEATIPLNQGWTASDPDRVNTITASGVDADGNYEADADSVTVDSIGDAGLVQRTGLGFQATGAAVPGDVDTYQFEAAAGTALKLQLKASVNLKLELHGVDGQTLLTQSGAKISVGQTLADSGLYTACVSLSGGGGGGEYSIKLSGKAPKAKMKASGTLVSGDAQDDYYVTMAKGSLLAASVSSKDFDPTLTVMDPIGNVIPLGGYSSAKGGKIKLKNLPLPAGAAPYLTGDYTVQVGSGSGTGGLFKLSAGGKAPKAAKQKLLYPVLAGTSASKGVARGGAMQLKVAGAAQTASHNTVYINGRAVAPDSVSLKGGKGTINVTVPADMIVGTVPVYFVRSDSQVNEKSNPLDISIIVP